MSEPTPITSHSSAVDPRWHSGMVWSLGLLLASRLILLVLAPLAEPYKRLHFLDDRVVGYYWHSTREQPFYEITSNIYLDMWARSDSWQYLDIAENGYYLEPGPAGYGTVACFPLYPLLIRSGAKLVGGHFLEVALGISALASWGAATLLYRMVVGWRGKSAARLATLGLFAFPSAFFLTTVFPHSLFLMLCLASLMAADRDQYLIAGLLAALAGAARTEGFVLIPALAFAYWERHRCQIRLDALLGLLVAPLGLGAYMAYLWWRFDKPVAFVEIHHQFGRSLSNPILTLLRPIWDHLFNVRHFLTYLVGGWLIVASLSRVPRPALVFGWLLFLVPLATGQYESIYRVQLTVFPIYLALAAVRPRWVAWFQIAMFAGLQVLMGCCFIAGVRLN